MSIVDHSKCHLCEFESNANPAGATTEEKNAYVALLEHFSEKHKGQGHTCGRRIENGMDDDTSPFRMSGKGRDFYLSRNDESPGGMGYGEATCTYCGSLSPGRLFEMIEEGAEIGPTDKSYKIYVQHGGHNNKFYFQHFDESDMKKFIDLINAKTMKIGYPGYFYRKPFFVA